MSDLAGMIIDYGSPQVVSGWGQMSRDEMILLTGYRAVKQQRKGLMLIEMAEGRVVKYVLQPDFGSAQILNSALGVRKLRE